MTLWLHFRWGARDLLQKHKEAGCSGWSSELSRLWLRDSPMFDKIVSRCCGPLTECRPCTAELQICGSAGNREACCRFLPGLEAAFLQMEYGEMTVPSSSYPVFIYFLSHWSELLVQGFILEHDNVLHQITWPPHPTPLSTVQSARDHMRRRSQSTHCVFRFWTAVNPPEILW